MKELSIEEKAQRYDEAIKLAKDSYNYPSYPGFIRADVVFPELKKSEDERIRKAFIEYFKNRKADGDEDETWYGISYDEILDWLEAHGESYTKRDVDDAYLKGVTDTKNEIETQYEATYQIRKDIATFILNYKGDIKDRAKWIDYLGIKVSFVEKQDDYHKGFHDGYNLGVHEEKSLRWTRHDELVRKEAISCLKHWKNLIPSEWNEDYKNILIWLENELDICVEKQGEQKPIDKVEPKDFNSIDPQFGKSIDKAESKFHEGDWITFTRKNGTREVLQVSDIIDDRYYFNYLTQLSWSIKECNEKCHLWTIQDAKDGDVLYESSTNTILIFRSQTCGWIKIYCDFWINKNKFTGIDPADYGRVSEMDLKPATKEQRDLFFKKMKEAGYEWDAEKKELKKIIDEKQIKKNLQDNNFRRMFEQNPVWNKEDEKMYNDICSDIEKASNNTFMPELTNRYLKQLDWFKFLKERVQPQPKQKWSEEDEKMIRGLIVICDEWTTRHSFYPIENCEIEKLKNWLESLKDRYNWKPSDEQMKALAYAVFDTQSHSYHKNLSSLEKQLKKLREE